MKWTFLRIKHGCKVCVLLGMTVRKGQDYFFVRHGVSVRVSQNVLTVKLRAAADGSAAVMMWLKVSIAVLNRVIGRRVQSAVAEAIMGLNWMAGRIMVMGIGRLACSHHHHMDWAQTAASIHLRHCAALHRDDRPLPFAWPEEAMNH